MWDLADGLVQQTTIDVRNEDAQKYGQAFQAFFQGDTLTVEKLLEECAKVGLDAERIASVMDSLQSA